MKRNRKNNLLAWMSASALVWTTACSDDVDLGTATDTFGTNGGNLITFVIAPEQQNAGTRAGDGETSAATPTKPYSIGDGTNADVLIFAIYEVGEYIEKDGEITGTGYYTLTEEFKNPSDVTGTEGCEIKLGYGQNAVWVKNLTKTPYKLQIAADPEKVYQIVLWAQNHASKAFDTTDLEKVEVKYSDTNNPLKNNDELRDAFCASKPFFGNTKDPVYVTLRRPLAQINVGSAGWDYESTARLEPDKVFYTTSQITLKGVARFYNVTTGRTYTKSGLDQYNEQHPVKDEEGNVIIKDEEATTNVTLAFNTIPALMHISEEDFSHEQHPLEEFLRVTLYSDEVHNANKDDLDENGYFKYVDWAAYDQFIVDKEWSEREDRNPGSSDGETSGDDDPESEGDGDDTDDAPESEGDGDDTDTVEETHPKTETFKYLSMTYVLVPEATTKDGLATASVLESVKFEVSGGIVPKSDDAGSTDGVVESAPMTSDPNKPFEVFEITHVPVQKNWRTNIIGFDFFLMEEQFKIYIKPEYCGDHNSKDEEWLGGYDGSDDDGWTSAGNGAFDDEHYKDNPYEGEPKDNDSTSSDDDDDDDDDVDDDDDDDVQPEEEEEI